MGRDSLAIHTAERLHKQVIGLDESLPTILYFIFVIVDALGAVRKLCHLLCTSLLGLLAPVTVYE